MTCLYFCLFGILSQAEAWKLPPAQYLSDFAKFHDRASIVIYLPDNVHDHWMKWHREEFAMVDQHRMIPIAYVPPNIANLSMVQRANEDLHVFIIDDSEELLTNQSIKQFHEAYGLRNRTSREYWLLDIGVWKSAFDALEALKNLGVDMDDDFYWYSHREVPLNSANVGDSTVDMWEIYRRHEDFPLSTCSSGNWSKTTGIKMDPDEKWERRKDLTGVVFRVSTLPSIPYISQMIPIEGKQGYFAIEGMFAEIFFALQDIMNFSYTVEQPPDYTWGALQPNGSWTGIIKMLQEQTLDIAVTDFTVTMARSFVITFAEPITQVHHRLFIKNPAGTFNYHAYVEPLHYLAWVGILMFCLLSPPFLFWTSKYGERDPKYYEFTLEKCLVFVISSLTLRGWSDTPTTAASRTAFFSLLVASTILYWHWEAMLISYLSTRVIVLPFDDLRTLLDNSNFKIAIIPDSSYQDAFKYSSDPDWQEAWKTRIEPYLDDYRGQTTNMIQFPLKDTSVALYDNYFSISAFDEYTDCQIIDAPAKLNTKPYAFGFQKDSPYLGIFNFYLKEMREKGLLKQIMNKYQSSNQVCPDLNGLPLGFDSCFTAFLALIGGMTCGLVLVLIELISRKAGWNLRLLGAYDRRGQQDFHLDHLCRDEIEKKNCLIQSLSMQVQLLESTVYKLQGKSTAQENQQDQ